MPYAVQFEKAGKPSVLIVFEDQDECLKQGALLLGVPNVRRVYCSRTADGTEDAAHIIKPLIDGLRQLNVYAESLNQDSRPPIIIKGPIKPCAITIDGEDSQPVSALLIVSAFSKGPIEIKVENPGETPWVELTLNWLDLFNIKYENHEFKYFKIYGDAKIKGFDVTIPSDFSSISFTISILSSFNS